MKLIKQKGWYVGVSPDEPRTFAVSERLFTLMVNNNPHRKYVEWWCVNFPVPDAFEEVRLNTNVGSIVVKDYPNEASVARFRQEWGQPRMSREETQPSA